MAIARVPVPEAVEAAPPGAVSRWLAATREFCRARTLGAVGAAVIVVMFAVALLAPVLSPYDPEAVDFRAMLARPSLAHWLGPDSFRRHPRLGPGHRRAAVRGCGARRRLRPRADRAAPHAAERDGAVPHHADGVSGAGDPGRGLAVVPRARRAGADGGVGAHAPRRGRRVRGDRALDGHLPGPRDQPLRVRVQSLR